MDRVRKMVPSRGPTARRLAHIQETVVRLHPGRLCGFSTRSAGVTAACLRGREVVRVRPPGGPLLLRIFRAAGPTERHLACNQEIGVRLPGCPLHDSKRKVAGYGWPGLFAK